MTCCQARIVFVSLLCWAGIQVGAGEVGPASAVAPDAEGSRMQMWPSAAWSDQAQCWLVVWREGDMTEEKTDILGARISADGKPLDPKGIRIGVAPRMQDRPVVVSDGKNFLVVWEDLRNGNDWDVYGARVSGEGVVLDPEGILVAGGPRNQCRPAAAFHGGVYLVVFQHFVPGSGRPGNPGTGYATMGIRLTPEGKALENQPFAMSDPEPKMHVWQPATGAGGQGALVAAYLRDFGPDSRAVSLGSAWAPMPVGDLPRLLTMVKSSNPAPYKNLPFGSRTTHQPPAVAWTGSGYLLAFPRKGRGLADPDDVAVLRLDEFGQDLGEPKSVGFGGRRRMIANPRVSLAFNGHRGLLTQDSVAEKAGTKRGEGARLHVRGSFLTADGNAVGESFAIAGDAELTREYMQGFAAAGPADVFLTVWSEARGVDDVKICVALVRYRE